MRFDLTDLRLFLNVLEAGSITAGGEATHMTLASASERIRGMEGTLGTPLLVRERRGVRPTAAGHTLAQQARLVLHQVDRLQGELAGYGRGLKGHIRLLCNTSALSEHLPQALSGFLSEHPQISVDLEERVSYEIVDAVHNALCDIGVVSDAADLSGLQSFVFRADPLALIVPRGHALAQRTSASLADVVDQPFVGLSEGSALQEHVEHHARRQGRRLNYRVRLRSLEAICRMVGAGIGVGIVPQAVAVRCARSAGIKRIPLSDPWAARKLLLCVRDLDALPAHTRQLIQHLLTGAPHR